MSEAEIQAPPVHAGAAELAAALARINARQMTAEELIGEAGRLAAHDLSFALTLYKTWLALNNGHPGAPAIYFNYAVCLSDSGDLPGAINALRETIRLKSDFGPPYINLGGLLERMGQAGLAVETWLSFVSAQSAVTPDALTYKLLALKQAGRVLEAAQEDAAAEDTLRQSLELNHDQPDVMQHLIALRQRQCKWPVLAASNRLEAPKLQSAISPLSAAYHTDDPIFHLANAYNYARHSIGRPARPRLMEVPRAPEPGRRLRIGYVSSDLRDHAVGFAMTDVLETHNRENVEVFAYYCGINTSDETHRRSKRAVDHWTDLNGIDDARAAQLIRQHGIDILVDLNGYTKDARTKVFAMRPAPVAVNWFGFPGSMGSPYHHYIVADNVIIPPESETYYSEKVLRLPCYQPNDRKRTVAPAPTRQQLGLPEDAFVFCCLNGMQKLTPRCFARWMTILREVPNSVLWLFSGTADTNERLRAQALAAGVAPDRLIFAGRMPNPQHLARMQLADLFLDNFPYGAHTTASDALWVGLPILALSGRSFATRVCASLVTAAGLPEMVCHTPEAYVARAIELARDRPQLAALRARLKASRDTCTLFDTPGLVRSLEALYGQMQEDRRAGTLPQPDLANLDIYHEIGAAEDLDLMETLDDTAYLARYRERLAELDADFPVRPDGRLWRR
ncbi:O-linked N-acetylglucosamine transferase [Muricoccus aerilatus]|uniref:O-linked N-acetylglucosamine transferase, SPINDLY family protein n=1 Tax=Muricoccus aerilatus TaxID=452982 RepID=UPI000A46D597|nr:O-linked N-acetylglucosamine transferase [Roseomonas aerilata]